MLADSPSVDVKTFGFLSTDFILLPDTTAVGWPLVVSRVTANDNIIAHNFNDALPLTWP